MHDRPRPQRRPRPGRRIAVPYSKAWIQGHILARHGQRRLRRGIDHVPVAVGRAEELALGRFGVVAANLAVVQRTAEFASLEHGLVENVVADPRRPRVRLLVRFEEVDVPRRLRLDERVQAGRQVRELPAAIGIGEYNQPHRRIARNQRPGHREADVGRAADRHGDVADARFSPVIEQPVAVQILPDESEDRRAVRPRRSCTRCHHRLPGGRP